MKWAAMKTTGEYAGGRLLSAQYRIKERFHRLGGEIADVEEVIAKGTETFRDVVCIRRAPCGRRQTVLCVDRPFGFLRALGSVHPS